MACGSSRPRSWPVCRISARMLARRNFSLSSMALSSGMVFHVSAGPNWLARWAGERPRYSGSILSYTPSDMSSSRSPARHGKNESDKLRRSAKGPSLVGPSRPPGSVADVVARRHPEKSKISLVLLQKRNTRQSPTDAHMKACTRSPGANTVGARLGLVASAPPSTSAVQGAMVRASATAAPSARSFLSSRSRHFSMNDPPRSLVCASPGPSGSSNRTPPRKVVVPASRMSSLSSRIFAWHALMDRSSTTAMSWRLRMSRDCLGMKSMNASTTRQDASFGRQPQLQPSAMAMRAPVGNVRTQKWSQMGLFGISGYVDTDTQLATFSSTRDAPMMASSLPVGPSSTMSCRGICMDPQCMHATPLNTATKSSMSTCLPEFRKRDRSAQSSAQL
mmetsp:Transcript_25377/g.63641  ORF Transcript_25377/g.63641 Transcript_25377/m.63641 type:complete len:391 (-) Transcript_25377:249-1421(-)